MKNKLIYLFIACMAIWISSTGFILAQHNLTQAQLKEDFSLLKSALQEAHPGLYRYNSKDQFDSLFANTAGMLNHDMSQQDLFQLLLPLVAQIKCGHTKFHPDNNWSDNYYFGYDKVFPFKLFFRDNKAWIIDGYDNNFKVTKGAEVIAINNMPVVDIIDKLLKCGFSDGNNTTFKYIEMSKFFSAYYANLFEAPDTFKIIYRDDHLLQEVKVPAISRSIIDLYEKQQLEKTIKSEPYSLTFPMEKTALLTISSFWMDRKDMDFDKFLKKSFHEINLKETTHLVIDLRDNEGGKDTRGALLLSYLMDKKFRYYDRLEASTNKKFSFAKQARLPKFYGVLRILLSKTDSNTYLWKHNRNIKLQNPQKDPFTGKVFVLTNGASFSVTAEFAAVTHYLKRATFIGEETGGAYYGNNSGTFVIVTLPNSRLNVGIPMLAYYTAVKDYPAPDRGIIPDYEVRSTVQDILNGKDAVLDFTLQLINPKIAE
jgi:hypothetical protein